MKHALDTNGDQIVKGCLASYRGQIVSIKKVLKPALIDHEIVMIGTFEEDNINLIGYRWIHHPDKELTLIPEQETTFLLLKHKVNE